MKIKVSKQEAKCFKKILKTIICEDLGGFFASPFISVEKEKDEVTIELNETFMVKLLKVYGRFLPPFVSSVKAAAEIYRTMDAELTEVAEEELIKAREATMNDTADSVLKEVRL